MLFALGENWNLTLAAAGGRAGGCADRARSDSAGTQDNRGPGPLRFSRQWLICHNASLSLKSVV